MNKKLTALMLCAVLALSGLSGCADLGSGGSESPASQQESVQQTESQIVHQAELVEPESSVSGDSVRISLEGNTARADGSGCSVSGAMVTITESGTYILSGTLEGQVIVDAKGEKVRLVLDGADIACDNSSPIYIKKGKEVTVTLAEGSVNTLTDGAKYVYDDAEAEEPDAALFSKVDLILEGGGSLTVNANFNNGIQSKDTLEIHSGAYIVNAANHGITGKDSLAIGGGSFSVTAGGDGVRSNNADSSDVGWISILGGTFDINAGQDGIQAQNSLHIGGGDMTIASGDDALHADGGLAVSGGSILITESFEGIEGVTVEISGGCTDITASDDGINSAGGSDSASERPGFNMFAADSDCSISISGGTVIVNASGDGIDSNGSIHITGGTLVVNGPTNSGNSPLDYAGECVISGGTVAVSGSAGMAQGGSASSTQANMLLCFNSGIMGGTLVSLTDESGNVVCSFAPAKDFSSVFVSFPAMEVGQTYKLWLGGSCSGRQENGIYTDGSLSGAAEITDVTVSRINTNYGGGGGFGGGPGGPGGGPGGHGGPGGPGHGW